jgi:excisionase family DNA binding protein
MHTSPITCTIADACRLSGIGRTTLYGLMGAGAIRSVRSGRRRLVVVDSLRAYLATLPDGGLAPTRA